MEGNESEEKINYETVGRWIRKVRTKHDLTQSQAAEYFGVSRTVLSKYENGSVRPRWEDLEKFAKAFNENVNEVWTKVSVAIPDTCALLKNKRLLHMLLEDYSLVVIPSTVISELCYRKNHAKDRGEKRLAWQIMANIDYYLTEYPDRFQKRNSDHFKIYHEVKNIENDLKIMALAREIEKDTVGDVVIITDDIDIALGYEKAVRIDDYIAHRSTTEEFFSDITDLDQEYHNIEYYKKSINRLNLNSYLTDGMTLLISCIRCRSSEKVQELGFQPSEKQKYNKLRFLIENGADINRNDNARYCLSPLAHCVQIGDWEAFNILLEAGCDYNKASRDELTASYMKVGKLNEGNTPLMLGCWHGRKRFVEKLCSFEDISLNQQDCNGYTALIKCAVQRYNRKKAGQSYDLNEYLYQYLLDRGADPLVRDRNNHTAADWWKHADDPDYRGGEQWD